MNWVLLSGGNQTHAHLLYPYSKSPDAAQRRGFSFAKAKCEEAEPNYQIPASSFVSQLIL